MLQKLDHIVHFINHPEAVAEKLNQLGIHTPAGGHHEEHIIFVSYFDDLSYLELVRYFDK